MILRKAKFALPLIASALLFTANAEVITLSETTVTSIGSENWFADDPYYFSTPEDLGDHDVTFSFDISDIHSNDVIRNAQLSTDVYFMDGLEGDVTVFTGNNEIGTIIIESVPIEEDNYFKVESIDLDVTAIDWDQDDLSLTLSSASGLWGEIRPLTNGNYAGLTVATPEPCTSILTIMGLGLLGFFSRKKKVA